MSFSTIAAQGINRVLGDGTAGNPYQIRTATQLAALATAVNAGANQASVYYVQTADISLLAYANWAGIGNSTTAFAGNFDGNGFAIYNLIMTADYAGLFGVISGTIKNVNIESGTINGTIGINRCGGIAGSANGGTITGCINKANVNGFSLGASSCYCCGILGLATTGTVTISDCINLGTITHTSGNAAGTIRLAAGISRKAAAATLSVSRCLNAGIVTGQGTLSGTWVRQAVESAAGTVANNYFDSTVSVSTDDEATGMATANCQGTDALTDAGKLVNLGTTYWFARTGYPLPIRFQKNY